MLLTEALRAAGLPVAAGLPAAALAGLTADSREVRPGVLFAALPGARADGRRFIAEAARRGALAVLAHPCTPWPEDAPALPVIEHPEPRRALAQLAAALAGLQPDVVAAVTGTNGKTSTAEFLRQIWTLLGHRAASLGTLGVMAPGHKGGGGLTTPDPVTLAHTLAELAREGVGHAALEASSHGLDQFRLDGVRLSAAGFSNLSRDHLDYHGDLAAYRAAKLRLFSALLPGGRPAVANADMGADTLAALRDACAGRVLRTVGENGELLRLVEARPLPHGQALLLEAEGVRREMELSLPGRFQADNVLLAAGLAWACGTGMEAVLDALPRLAGVRGRMELVARLPSGACAFVDYAHTPDALSRLLAALRPHARRLVCVFGAGGDRDAGKRPLMGAAVAAGADLAIVTDDNPRSEDPAAIRAAVLAGCPGGLDRAGREQAIAEGLSALGAGDVLAVAGKGHEDGQTVDDRTLPFDDAAVIRRLAGGMA